MIMFWNRREVYMGYSLEKFYEARQKLEAYNVKYTYRLAGNDTTFFFESRRAYMGSLGENPALSTMYYHYVHKKDYELACMALRSC